MKLILDLVRHGKTQWNVERRYLGHEEQGVLTEGLAELASLREHVRAVRYAAIYCSDLLRCRQTLHYLLADTRMSMEDLHDNRVSYHLDRVHYDSNLRELDFGDWEGRTYDELKEVSAYRQWIDDPAAMTPPNGESWNAFQSRIRGFLESVADETGARQKRCSNVQGIDAEVSKVLVVTHGGVIRQIAALTLPDTAFWELSVPPGERLRLRLSWDGTRLLSELVRSE